MRDIPRWPRRGAGALVGLLATVLLGALSLVTAPSASATGALCDQYGSAPVSGGTYIVQNNEWGDTIGQCVNAFDGGFTYTSGYHNLPGSPKPAGYPSIYAGCHWGNCSSGNGLPQQVSSFTNPQSHVDFTTTGDGQWDAAYDIWFDTNAHPSGQNNGTELMIWANHAGPPTPYGRQVGTVWLEGANWDVWYGPQSSTTDGVTITWNTVSYVRQQPVDSLTVNIKDFTNDSKARGYLQPSWYMTSVQAGFEPWVGGPGLGVRNFSYTPDGSASTGSAIVGRQSGRCLDLSEWGSTDGTPVQLWDCSGDWNQRWTEAGSTVVNPHTGKCLDVSGGAGANGTRVQLWTCNGTGAQQWRFNPNGTLTNPPSGKCLDAGGSANGSLLQIWDCWATANQLWSHPNPLRGSRT
ncbi:RICIN domain-containing protein [Streptomyces noboritoensis]|uniref:RICIN domain-containing protein n=1 Tax=Streptomyces noboritoensis TaxID=67337 RepID=A0ABV6TAI6_9ACTN